MASTFCLPDVGEGLTEAEIIAWRVAPGDTVALNEILVEVETAKAAVELPSPYAGVVAELFFPEGATVAVGAPIVAFAGSGDEADSVAAEATPAAADAPPAAGDEPDAPQTAPRQPVLVGYGVTHAPVARRPRRAVSAAPSAAAGSARHPAATPPVRMLARRLGVELADLTGSGPGGRITRADVERSAGKRAGAGPEDAATSRVPIRGVRKHTAQAMVRSAFTAPHVTEWLTVDVTRTVRLVERLRALPEYEGLRINPMVLVMRALLRAIELNPEINASWDEQAQEIVTYRDVCLGVAAATPRGLTVPNIPAAQRLPLIGLANALEELVVTARAGRTPPERMAGGTVTITNIGSFGVDAATPILNPGEAAILCFGRIHEQPWVHRGRVVPRQVTTLALSFDHRLVDGALGSRVLRDIGAGLHAPIRLLR